MKRRGWILATVLTLGSHVGPVQADAQEEFQTAIVRDNYIQMEKLLLRGMDPNTVDERGRPSLVKAMQLDSWRVADVLLAAVHMDINIASRQGETALMLACIKGHLDYVRRLIAMNADINRPGWTPLHYVASADHPHSVEIASLLLEHHAYVDAQSPNGSTPLMLAAQYASETMVGLLLNAGADVQLRNQQGLNAVDFARKSERSFMVQKLQAARQLSRRDRPGW